MAESGAPLRSPPEPHTPMNALNIPMAQILDGAVPDTARCTGVVAGSLACGISCDAITTEPRT